MLDLIYLLPSEAVFPTEALLNGEDFDLINSCEATLLMYCYLCAVVAYISSKPIGLVSFLAFEDESAIGCCSCYYDFDLSTSDDVGSVGVVLLKVVLLSLPSPSDGGLLDCFFLVY